MAELNDKDQLCVCRHRISRTPKIDTEFRKAKPALEGVKLNDAGW